MEDDSKSVPAAQERLILSQGGREIVSLGRKDVAVFGLMIAVTMVLSVLGSKPARTERSIRALAACGAERQECRDRVTLVADHRQGNRRLQPKSRESYD